MATQTFTARDTQVIERAQRKRRRVLVAKEDQGWLAEFASDPHLLLWRMGKRGALIPLGGGRYAVPDLGSTSVNRVPWQVLLDAELASRGPYYLGFQTALEEHHLTDMATPRITVAAAFRGGRIEGGFEVAGRPVSITQLTPRAFKFGLEMVRISRSERYQRSDLERTLVDCVHRPASVEATEMWVLAWGRALSQSKADIPSLCDYAIGLGGATPRRVGLILELAGHGAEARDLIPARARRSDRQVVLVDDGPAIDEGMEVHHFWRVHFNVPRQTIEGWLHYGK